MKRIYHTYSCKTLQNGAVLSGGSFCIRILMGMATVGIQIREGRKENTAIDRPKNYRAKLANASIRTARSCLAVSEKIILATLRYFPRKPCLTGSVHRLALVVQRAAKARVFTNKMIKS